jgi:hypothetical protein
VRSPSPTPELRHEVREAVVWLVRGAPPVTRRMLDAVLLPVFRARVSHWGDREDDPRPLWYALVSEALKDPSITSRQAGGKSPGKFWWPK